MAGMSRISALFTADTSQLQSGTRQAAASLQRLSSDVNTLKSSLGSLVNIQAAQLFGSITSGIATAVRSFASLASSSSETIDGLSKMAARLGVSYADMSGLALAADLAGVSVGSLAGAMTKADRAFIEAQRGSKTATDAFARIGLSLDDLGKLDPRARFDAIAQSIASLPTEAERAAAAIALFGRSGAELLPMFANGAQGIQEAREQAERLGLALTTVQGQNVEAMNDSWTLVRKSIEGVIQQVVANLAPAITAINDMWLDFVESTGGRNIGEFISDGLVSGAEYLATVADYFYEKLSEVWANAAAVSIQWSSVWDVANRFLAAVQLVANSAKIMMAGLIGAYSAAVEFGLKALREAIALIPGMDESVLDPTIAGVEAFRDSINESITAAMSEANANWRAMMGEASADAGDEIDGPFSKFVAKFREIMLLARNPDAARPAPNQVKAEAVQVQIDTGKLATAIEARSKEGVSEMLRLMYGSSSNVDEKQLAVQEQILDAQEETVAAIKDIGFEEVGFV